MNYINHLSENAYRNPAGFSQTMDRKHLKETLLHTDGWVLSCGYMWDIQSKSLGAGVYRVTLKKKND